MQKLEWYLADLKSTGKNTIETVEKSLTDMFIRLSISLSVIIIRPKKKMSGEDSKKEAASLIFRTNPAI